MKFHKDEHEDDLSFWTGSVLGSYRPGYRRSLIVASIVGSFEGALDDTG